MDRTYNCWMLNCWCITWPVGFKKSIYLYIIFGATQVWELSFDRSISLDVIQDHCLPLLPQLAIPNALRIFVSKLKFDIYGVSKPQFCLPESKCSPIAKVILLMILGERFAVFWLFVISCQCHKILLLCVSRLWSCYFWERLVCGLTNVLSLKTETEPSNKWTLDL